LRKMVNGMTRTECLWCDQDRPFPDTGQSEVLPSSCEGPQATTILSADRGQCRWPLWNDPHDAKLVCGAPVTDGSSYCQEHSRLSKPRGTVKSLLKMPTRDTARLSRHQFKLLWRELEPERP